MRILILIAVVCLAACEQHLPEMNQVRGYAPVYSSLASTQTISRVSVHSTVHPGKIYAYEQYLFQVEENEGIHIIDNSQPQQAHKIGFLQVPGCSELAIRSGFLYTNHLGDLVVIDLNNMASPQVVKRIEGAFPQFSQEYPPFNNVYFECVDPSKGIVVGWEEKTLDNPKCRR